MAFFAERVGLSGEQVTSLTPGRATDACWNDERDRVFIEAEDSLHDTARVGDPLCSRLAHVFADGQLLDLSMPSG